MPNTYPPELQSAWAHVVAHAWKNPEFFERLTKNPKKALEGVLTSENLRENTELLSSVHTILSDDGPVFPLPPLPRQLQHLDEAQLTALADQEGFFGILRYT